MKYQLHDSIGFRVNQTANIVNNQFSKVLKKYNIAPEQRATLEIIKYEENVNQTKIAEILGKDKTTVSRGLKTLENKNLIYKKQVDKRTNIIKLTKLAEEILENSCKEVQSFRDNLISSLNKEEIDSLHQLLNKITNNIEKRV